MNCDWVQDSEDPDIWITNCGRKYYLSEGTPSENGMEICYFCGKRLEEIPAIDEVPF